MSGDEIIGDIAQAGLTARAVEPDHGEAGRDKGHHGSACLNCGTALVGSHCHSCGQSAHIHRTLGAFFSDFLHGVLHFEGKIWRTLPLLAWNPGKLTREYIDGRRASYVSPIALFLFVVFLTFALYSALGDPINWQVNNNPGDPNAIAQAEVEAKRKVAELEEQLAQAKSAGTETSALEGQLSGARSALEGVQAMRRGKISSERKVAEEEFRVQGLRRVEAAWQKISSNPQLALFKLQSNAYKYSWLLIPISVPFLWLLFPFSRRFHLYDHTVFVTYSLSFMMILAALATFALAIPAIAWIASLIALLAPVHLYRQLRGSYGLSRRSTLWRLPVLLCFAVMALLLWGLTLLALVISG